MEKSRLPEDFKAKWIAALRSGEYKQCKMSLCKAEPDGLKTYCCIGVGYLVAKGIDPTDSVSGYIHPHSMDIDGVPSLLIGGVGGSNAGGEVRLRLVRMNDEENKSFLEIADYIEENL